HYTGTQPNTCSNDGVKVSARNICGASEFGVITDCQPCRVPIGSGVAGSVLVPVQSILDRVHRQPGTVGGVVEAGLGKVDVEGRIVDMAREGGKDIVAVVVVHQLVRADRLTPGVVLQLGKVLAGGLGVIPGVAHHVLVDVEGTFPAAVALLGDLLDPLRTGVHMALLILQLAVAHRVDIQVVILRAGVVDHIVAVVGLARMGRDQIVHPQAKAVVGVGRLVALPVGALPHAVGGVVHEGLRRLLAGLGNAVAALVVAVGVGIVGGRGLFHELVQLVVLIVYTLVLDSFKHQITQSIVGIIGHFFGDVAGHHAVQLIVGVDMRTLVGFVGLLIVLILGAGIF